jgi:6,7-dimethyl-8-ribityllumazine synthase
MVRYVEGEPGASGLKIGIVVSRFNDFITSHLLSGALEALGQHGADEKDIEVVRVPGAFEIPMAAKKLCDAKKYDAVVCLGAVIRGATPHFDYVAGEAARGVATIAREAGIPVVFGVLTTDNVEQAVERAGGKSGNKGVDAALAAVEMATLYRKL